MKNLFYIFKRTSKKERLEEENFRLKAENDRLKRDIEHLIAQSSKNKNDNLSFDPPIERPVF